MPRRRAVLAAALLAAARLTHASPRDLFIAARDDGSDVCPNKDHVACSAAVPSGFCCPQNTQCLALAAGTTALCCPKGSTCNRIEPIACDVRLQNPKDHADAVVLTSVFDVELDVCDTGCCPFGYSCAKAASGNGQCVRSEDQSKKPGEGPKSSTTATATATTTATSSKSTASSPSETTATATETSSETTTPASSTATATPAADTEKGISSRTVSVIGGVVGGALVVIIIIVVAILCLRRRRRVNSAEPLYDKPPSRHHGPPSIRGLTISDPVVQQGSEYRTDFMLKSPSAHSSISNQPVNARWSGGGGGGGGTGGGLRPLHTRNLTPPSSSPPRRDSGRWQHRLSIPNPFRSPDQDDGFSPRCDSPASPFDHTAHDNLRTGHVTNGRLAPIRGMRASRRLSRRIESQHVLRENTDDAEEGCIDIFADEHALTPDAQHHGSWDGYGDVNRITTFSDLMEKADLGPVHRGQRYVPGTPSPRV